MGSACALFSHKTESQLDVVAQLNLTNRESNLKWIFGALTVATLAGCASPQVVSVRKPGDADLNCAQLKNEYADALDFEAKARKERTVTGTNVAAALLFWPGLVGTYANTEEAINAAKKRQELLKELAAAKKCKSIM